MKPMEGCSLFGAYRACVGLADTVILLHSVVGCNWGTMTYHLTNHLNQIHQASTVIYDEDVIGGGESILRKALLACEQSYPAAKAIILISGCVPSIIGDDLAGIVSSLTLTKPVIIIEAPGFAAGDDEGFEKALMSLGRRMKAQEQMPRSVNLLGLSVEDYKAEADIAAIAALVKGEITINTVIGCDSYEQLMQAPKAELNLVFHRGAQLAAYMEKVFDIPYIIVDYPYGITGCIHFLRQIGVKMGIDFSAEIAGLQAGIRPVLRQVTHYLQTLYGMPAAVIGNKVHGSGLYAFLTEEIGMEVVVFEERTSQNGELIYDKIRQSDSVLIFGSSFEKEISEELNIPLFRYSYPVFDKITVSGVPSVGVQGTAAMLEDIINLVLSANYKTKGVYAPLIREGSEQS